jgi:hypothetical protein
LDQEQGGFSRSFSDTFIKPLLRRNPENRPDIENIIEKIEKFKRRESSNKKALTTVGRYLRKDDQKRFLQFKREYFWISILVFYIGISAKCYPLSLHWDVSLFLSVVALLFYKRVVGMRVLTVVIVLFFLYTFQTQTCAH